MGCASSAPKSADPAQGMPGGKQGQSEKEKDEAAANIQNAASSYLQAKNEQAKDAAAADIQTSAAEWLKKKREPDAAPAASAPPLLQNLDEVAKNVVDAVAEISHRIFGTDKKEDDSKAAMPTLNEASAPAAEAPEKWKRPSSAAPAQEATEEMQYSPPVGLSASAPAPAAAVAAPPAAVKEAPAAAPAAVVEAAKPAAIAPAAAVELAEPVKETPAAIAAAAPAAPAAAAPAPAPAALPTGGGAVVA